MSLDETLKTNVLNTTKKIKNYIDNLINSHNHGNISNDGKVGSTSGKPLITTTDGAITTGSFGSSSGTFCQGNDDRLSDPRTPTIHTHSKSEITDFPTIPSASNSTPSADVSGGAIGSSNNYAKADHQHPLSSAYSASGHNHGDITNTGAIGSTANLPLITTTNGKIATGSFGTSANTFCEGNDSRLSDARTPTSHTHGNLQNDGKIGTSNNASKNVVTDANGKITTEAKPDISGKADKLGGVAQVTDANSSDYTNIFTSRGGVPYYSSGDDNQQTINMFIDRQLGYKAESNHNHSGTYAPVSHTQASSTITDMSTVQVVVTYTDDSTETLTLFKQTSS